MDHVRIPGRVQAGRDQVPDPARLDDHGLGDPEGVPDADDRLERLALRAPARGPVQGLVAGERRVIKDARHYLGRDAVPVVGHRHPPNVTIHRSRDRDFRLHSGRLAGVERVIEQLLDDYVAEPVRWLPGLAHQGPRLQEVGSAADGERAPLEQLGGHDDVVLSVVVPRRGQSWRASNCAASSSRPSNTGLRFPARHTRTGMSGE